MTSEQITRRASDDVARHWVEAACAGASVLQTDVLVLGAGMAGLRAAVRARTLGRNVVLAYTGRGASPFIIGCNAPFAHADPDDTPEQYAADVIAGGCGLSDRRLVEVLTGKAVGAVRELAGLGAPMARADDRFCQRQLSGNWYARSVYHPEGLGAQALPALSARARELGVIMLSGHRAVRLLFDERRVCGALLRSQAGERWQVVRANAVVMALGGIGQLYDDSTYPGDVTASSYALGLEAGAPLVDMEFVQFEPLCTFEPESLRALELPTSMLAEGAWLLNGRGERFMFRYNPEWGERRIEKARLSLCIQQEIDEGRGVGGGVLYDATRVPAAVVEGYVRHCKRLRNAGLDPTRLRVPVRPAAHSQMGGLWIDPDAATPVAGLYAAGEAAGGVHGASRIAGNGGADALVFGDVAGAAAAAEPAVDSGDLHRVVHAAFSALASVGHARGELDPRDAQTRIRRTMAECVGIHRSAAGLQSAIDALDELASQLVCDARADTDLRRVDAFAALGMTRVARAIAASALARTESRGAHQRRDHPDTDEAWRTHLAVRLDTGARMHIDREAVL
ncbi:MAG: FAD-binding protein [Burkholderiaceae bacterium]